MNRNLTISVLLEFIQSLPTALQPAHLQLFYMASRETHNSHDIEIKKAPHKMWVTRSRGTTDAKDERVVADFE